MRWANHPPRVELAATSTWLDLPSFCPPASTNQQGGMSINSKPTQFHGASIRPIQPPPTPFLIQKNTYPWNFKSHILKEPRLKLELKTQKLHNTAAGFRTDHLSRNYHTHQHTDSRNKNTLSPVPNLPSLFQYSRAHFPTT